MQRIKQKSDLQGADLTPEGPGIAPRLTARLGRALDRAGTWLAPGRKRARSDAAWLTPGALRELGVLKVDGQFVHLCVLKEPSTGRTYALTRGASAGLSPVPPVAVDAHHREYAVRRLDLDGPDGRAQLERLRRQQEVLAAVDHPLRFRRFVQCGREVLGLAQRMDGTLEGLLRCGPLGVSRHEILGLAVLARVGDELARAHGHGVMRGAIDACDVTWSRRGLLSLEGFGTAPRGAWPTADRLALGRVVLVAAAEEAACAAALEPDALAQMREVVARVRAGDAAYRAWFAAMEAQTGGGSWPTDARVAPFNELFFLLGETLPRLAAALLPWLSPVLHGPEKTLHLAVRAEACLQGALGVSGSAAANAALEALFSGFPRPPGTERVLDVLHGVDGGALVPSRASTVKTR